MPASWWMCWASSLCRLRLFRWRAYISRELVKLGGQPKLREGFTTDNGNVILDVHNLQIMNPVELETTLNQMAGVVTNGLFARRAADVLLLGTPEGVKTLKA